MFREMTCSHPMQTYRTIQLNIKRNPSELVAAAVVSKGLTSSHYYSEEITPTEV